MTLTLLSWVAGLLLFSFVFGLPVPTTVVSDTFSSPATLSTGFDDVIFYTSFAFETTVFLLPTPTPSTSNTSSNALSATIPTSSSTLTSTSSSTPVAFTAIAPHTLSTAFAVPGRALQVFPIGLGVLLGLLAIVIIVVALVTLQRVKHRKEFRRKLAEEQAREGKLKLEVPPSSSPPSTISESPPEPSASTSASSSSESPPPPPPNEGSSPHLDDDDDHDDDEKKKKTKPTLQPIPESRRTSESSWPSDSSWPSPVNGEPPESLRDSFTSIQTIKLRNMATQTTWEDDGNGSEEDDEDGPSTPKPPIRRETSGRMTSEDGELTPT